MKNRIISLFLAIMMVAGMLPTVAFAELGEEFCVTVEAQGDGLQYQWYYRKAGREIYCVITDAWGNTVTN